MCLVRRYSQFNNTAINENQKKAVLLITMLFLGITISYAQSNTLGATGNVIYKHNNIDTQSKMIALMEQNEFDKAFNYFIEGAPVGTANFGPYAIATSDQSKANSIKFHTEYFDVKSMNQRRPSIYLENVNGKGGDVLSWYVFQLVRKSDNKEIAMPIHMIDSFNKDGKIIAEYAYYSNSLIYHGGKPPKND